MDTGEKIAAYVESILKNIDPNTIDGAINWGDLHCVEVSKHITLWPDTEEYYQVLIEEADPVNPELVEFVQEKLFRVLGHIIRVEFEW